MTMSGPGCNTCWLMKRPHYSKKADVVKPFFTDGGGRYMTTMRIDDLQVFSVYSMCSNVCFIANPVGVRLFLIALVDGFNHVSHRAIISRSFSRT